MKLRLATFLILLNTPAAFSQSGYNLHFKVDGWRDTVVYLTHYYGETHFITDTATVDKHGAFSFEGREPLKERGVYFISMVEKRKATRQFDLLISGDQNFSMSTRSNDLITSMRITGDEENSLFYENLKFQVGQRNQTAPYEKAMRDSTTDEAQRDEARRSYAKITERVFAFQDELIAMQPNSLTAKIIKAYRSLNIPAPAKKEDGTIDSTFQLRWYRQHIFDNFDLSEPGLICLPDPLYRQKIDEYLDRLYPAMPDSIMSAANRLIEKAKGNQQTYRYAVWTTLLKYQQPKIMGLDKVFVMVYDQYIASGEMNFWITASIKKAIKNEADRLRKSLIGNIAPNLVMQDQSLKPQALYDINNKYTILYIFDPDCGHCREETPKLVSFYNSGKWDVGVYAVSADTSMQKMRDYVTEMHMKWVTVNGTRTYSKPYLELYDAMVTPSLFVLDREKKIIAKQLPADRLNEFFQMYEAHKLPKGK